MLIRYSPDAKGRAVRKAVIYIKKEHGIKLEDIDTDAVRIITHLRNNGFEGYIVGGAVRDLLIGKKPKDFDIVTNAEPARIKRLFRNSRIIGKRFRLVHIFFGSRIFEVSTFRSLIDGTTGNVFGTMDEDVRRRDFTINALYYDPIKEQVIDYAGGVRDIRNKKLVPVIPLSVIFLDDPVRMLRAVKYSVSTGCTIPRKLAKTIRKSASLLQPVSPSRLTEELIKIVNSGNSFETIAMLLKFDLFMYLQPAANGLIDENEPYSMGYRNSLKNLDILTKSDEPTRLGRKLVYLVTDLINCITDWKGHPIEVYAKVYHECRRFIMPMNPPRIELEFAVRHCLKEGGLAIRSPRTRGNNPSREDHKKRERPTENELAKSRSRRRNVRPKAPISASN